MDRSRPPRPSKRLIIGIVGTALILLGVGVAVTAVTGHGNAAHSRPSSAPAQPASATPAPYVPLTSAQVAALPEAKYNAVIPGLLPYDQTAPTTATTSYTLSVDTPIYGADRLRPVARFAALNFLNQPTVVTPVRVLGPWALVLTPARKTLPSATHGDAAAQTAGWIRTSFLHNPTNLITRIEVSVSKQTLTLIGTGTPQTFAVGVGATGTPTPTNVSGYLQARYLDPTQGQSIYPIQLTSLHSSAEDEPYTGHDGGLIGVHYYPDTHGDISHGCIRLTAPAITAVNGLPLGTLITITP